MVKKVQVPTLLSRAMFSGKPGPSGPRATETPVCPADPALALHREAVVRALPPETSAGMAPTPSP